MQTAPTTNTGASRGKGLTMSTTTFAATVSAADGTDAIARVERRLVDGFTVTGRTEVRSARHMLWTVEVQNNGGNADAAWVEMTSYGISPSDDLGSAWSEFL